VRWSEIITFRLRLTFQRYRHADFTGRPTQLSARFCSAWSKRRCANFHRTRRRLRDGWLK